MKKNFWYLMALLVFLVFFTRPAFAGSQSPESFAENKQWHKLLHYPLAAAKPGYITSDSFYLSANGRRDPLAELTATIKAFYREKKTANPGEKHARCRFPARFKLITRHVDLSPFGQLPAVNCQDYQNWRQQVDIHSLSVVFASGYMGNPASMYGHLFLKLNRSSTRKSDLLNTSLNYGAIVPEQENPVVYVLRGIFGGYDAGYSDQQFYRHHHNYGDVELRDMWEYKLNLSADDVDLIAAHIWEVLGNKFDYYFIDENCAFHIAKLLELVLTEPLIANSSLWVIPSAVAKGLEQANYQDKALLENITFIPSRESVLHDYYRQLTPKQKAIAGELINDGFNFANKGYRQLAVKEQKTILETLFQYQNVIKQKQADAGVVKANTRKLMRERLKLPPGRAIAQGKNSGKKAPHLGMKPSKYSLGVADIDSSKQYLTAGFRMTYFDDLSSSVARNPYANLEMLDFEFISDEKKTRLLRLDLLDLDALHTPGVPWRGETPYAWSVRAGYEAFNNACLDCGIYFVEGDIGKSYRFGENSLAYGMLGGKVFAGHRDDVTVTGKLGLLTSLGGKAKMKLELQQAARLNLSQSYRHRFYGEINYQFAPDWEVRFLLTSSAATLIGLKMNYYWGF
ncbi:DUF4105 domain-containing protein [Thalassomonas haliotis]|uniref:DUF4105 domain-containing protein n=1 Tax=Thalassomonas haliotis TaxID=485448 RepID=A0ABY7VH74_9GAMM|nr:DUF4105 domain-containing protein [Thalassomonas haliotis]WDE13084.1 DUF4105 domain-containing protein [Thalassomonas haliotis]